MKATDGSRGMMDAELGSQFLSDLILAPFWVVTRHAPDEVDVLARDARSAYLGRSRLPTPKYLEALTMPCDDRLGFDDDQGTIPSRPDPAESDPQEPVAGSKSSTFPRSLVGGELLA